MHSGPPGDDGHPAKPKYVWRHSGFSNPDDFSGWDGDIRFGRIYIYHLGYWVWFLNGVQLGSASGQEDTGREAAASLERAYDRVKGILIADGRFNDISHVRR